MAVLKIAVVTLVLAMIIVGTARPTDEKEENENLAKRLPRWGNENENLAKRLPRWGNEEENLAKREGYDDNGHPLPSEDNPWGNENENLAKREDHNWVHDGYLGTENENLA